MSRRTWVTIRPARSPPDAGRARMSCTSTSQCRRASDNPGQRNDPMSNLLAPGVGAVLSADIAVPEHERVMRFYSRVLGSGDDPLWRDDLMNNLGMPIIGLGARTDELSHLPLQWMPHIQVADVAASARRAPGLGGRELMHAR